MKHNCLILHTAESSEIFLVVFQKTERKQRKGNKILSKVQEKLMASSIKKKKISFLSIE